MMRKKQPIGFKNALEENDTEKETHEPQISRADIDEIVEEQTAREMDYQNHMRHYNTLVDDDIKRKNFKQTVLVVLYTLLAVCLLIKLYDYSYNKGAYDQCSGKGVYQKVTVNNETYIIKK